MPEPIFRSSEGHTPKPVSNHVLQDEVDTAAPDFDLADTDEFDAETISADDIDTESPEIKKEPISADHIDTESPKIKEENVVSETVESAKPSNTVRVAPPKPVKAAGGCARNVMAMFSIAALLVITILIVAIYYLFYYTPQNTTF